MNLILTPQDRIFMQINLLKKRDIFRRVEFLVKPLFDELDKSLAEFGGRI